MGLYKTENCFFTNNDIVSYNETDGSCLDGYYYRVNYNGQVREVRLIWDYDWQNDNWINKNGEQFFQVLEEHNRWNLFNNALDIHQIHEIFTQLSKK